MSFFGPAPNSLQSGGLPKGDLLGNYRTYEEAQQTAGTLVEGGIDVSALSIVGRDIRMVNRLRKRPGYPAVVLRSATQGAFFGLLIGLLLSAVAPADDNFQLWGALVMGIAIWVIFGVIGQALRNRRPGFAATSQVVAVSYDLVCDFSVTGQAQHLLRTGGRSMAGSATGGGPAGSGETGTGLNGAGGTSAGVNGPGSNEAASGGATSNGNGAGFRKPNYGADVEGQQSGHSATGTPQFGANPESVADTQNQADPGEGSAKQQPKWQFKDLPDGRPQFGVRTDQAGTPQQSQNTETSENSGSTDSPATAKESAQPEQAEQPEQNEQPEEQKSSE